MAARQNVEKAELIKKRVGQAVCLMRVMEGMTQAQLASVSGLSARYISRLECGLANPKLTTLEILADALNSDCECLFELVEQVFGNPQ
jgi:transcriptional regulator with XRE-family HTH domain